jgi:hypothetical protein
MHAVRERLRRVSASPTGRVVLLTLYYLGIIVGLALVHVGPDYKSAPFVYQAF